MRRVFLSIGSNVHPEIYIPQCIEKLKKQFKVLHISSVYETNPVGPAGTINFWNFAAEVETVLNEKDFSSQLRALEESLGRRRDPANRFAPRTIDIDVLPQSDYQNLAFIMIPLAEIAPSEMDSVTGKSFQDLADRLRSETRLFRKVF